MVLVTLFVLWVKPVDVATAYLTLQVKGRDLSIDSVHDLIMAIDPSLY